MREEAQEAETHEKSADQIFCIFGKHWRKIVIEFDDFLKSEVFGSALERGSAGQELEKYATERPEIGSVAPVKVTTIPCHPSVKIWD
jgi:hypothetical protein